MNENLCKKIIEYLMAQKEHESNLNGILLGIFEKEIEQLTQEIQNNLGYLISIDLIHVRENESKMILFKITDNAQKLS